MGRLHHLIGAIVPPAEHNPVFAQVYINDLNDQVQIRDPENQEPEIINAWNEIINSVNPFAGRFRQIGQQNHLTNAKFVIKERINNDLRRYNTPKCDEIAVLLPGDGSQETTFRDVVLTLSGGGLHRMNEMNSSYDPLHYPLLFPFGLFPCCTD